MRRALATGRIRAKLAAVVHGSGDDPRTAGVIRARGCRLGVAGLWTTLLLGVVLGLPMAAQEDQTLARQRLAAEQLWQNFITTYDKVALAPLARQDLDLKGRETLIAVLGPRYRGWKVDRAATVPDLLAEVRLADAKLNLFALTERLLGELLPKIDRYGHYEAMAEVEMLDEAARQTKGVFAINLVIDEQRRLHCFPDPDGPASRAGVLVGAELLEVDGVPVVQKSLAFAKMAFAGSKGVTVKVRQPQGRVEELTMARTMESFPSVTLRKSAGGVRVRIRAFDAGVTVRLRELLKAQLPIDRMILDLRGNGGGLLEEAVSVASLFLPKGTVIGYVRDRNGDKEQVAGDERMVTSGSIQVLLDRGTASAAELLAVSLKENLTTKVVLHGERSYGKGQRLLREPLAGGGMLTLSDGLMLSPAKTSWDQTGIAPDPDGK